MNSQKREEFLFIGQKDKSTATIINQEKYELESIIRYRAMLFVFMTIFIISVILFFAGIHEIPKDRELQKFYDKTCTMKNVSADDPCYDYKLSQVINNGKVCGEEYFPRVYEKKSIDLIIFGIGLGCWSIPMCGVSIIGSSRKLRNKMTEIDSSYKW